MSGLAAAITWTDSRPLEDCVARMLDAVPHRATDGRAEISGDRCALGVVRHETRACERRAAPIIRDQTRGVWVVADVRLDNTPELRSDLGSAREVTDTELVLQGYLRWGEEVAAKLVGDFAFVVWDQARQQLFAARDPFGTRPLFYSATPERLAFATEVGQLLALEDASRGIDEDAVREYLLQTYTCERNTFFRGIARVPAGHFLRARAGEIRIERYWMPPTEPLGFRSPEEYFEEFRRVFESAVTARLDTDRPLLAHLSGGLDSSSIVCMADAIYKEGAAPRPSLRVASLVFPGLDCDETPFIDAVAQRVAFRSERSDGATPGPAEYVFEPAHPVRSAVASTNQAMQRMASDAKARVVLSGLGGDELLFERGICRDLLANFRLLDFYREATLAPRYSSRSRGFYLRDALVSCLPPKWVEVYRRVRRRRPTPPIWWSAQLRASSMRPGARPPPQSAWASRTQECTWGWLASPRLTWCLETEELLAARAGLEPRYPFLDVRLARLVLAIPYEHRLPGGRMKLLLRRALDDLLPPEIAGRTRVTDFDSILGQSLRQSLPMMREVLFDWRWESAPYVDQHEARKLLDTSDASDTSALASVWDIAMLELWIRRSVRADKP